MSKAVGSFDFRNYDIEGAWRAISKVIDSIMGLGTAGLINSDEWCSAFYQVYMMHMCNEDPYGVNFYFRIREYFLQFAKKIQMILASLEETEFSDKYQKEWEKYSVAIGYVNRLFDSFNRSLRKIKSGLIPIKNDDNNLPSENISQLQEVNELMLECWGIVVVENSRKKIHDNFSIYFQEILEDESGCITVHRLPLVRAFAASIHTTKPRRLYMEESGLVCMIKEQAEFIRVKWFEDFSREGFPEFLVKLSKYLSRIFIITSNVLEENSEMLRNLRQKLADLIINERQKEIVDHFQENLSLNGEYSILRRVFKISNDSDNLCSLLLISFSNFVSQESRRILLLNLYSSDTLCESIFKFYNHYKFIISTYLDNDSDFSKKLDAGIQAAVNHVESDKMFLFNLSAYFISLIFSTNDWSVFLEHKHVEIVYLIYSQLSHKDSFHKNLIYFIGKKLVLTHPFNPQPMIFSPIIKHIKDDFYRIVDASIQDYNAGYDIDECFSRISVGMTDFSYIFTIFRSHIWGFEATNFEAYYGEDLRRILSEFYNFYRSQKDYRKLNYIHSESNGSVQYEINKRSYILEVNGYQLTLLMHLYNSKQIDQLVDITKLSENQIIENLSPLLKADIILFNKISRIFTFNLKFSSNLIFYNFNKLLNHPTSLVNSVSVSRSQSSGIADVENNPLIFLIARTVKSIKRVERNQLIEMLKSNKYKIPIIDNEVDSQIECLIKKDILAKDENNPNVYIYLE